MTTLELVATLRARGVIFVVDKDRLFVRPKRLVTADERALLRAHKAQVCALRGDPQGWALTMPPPRVPVEHPPAVARLLATLHARVCEAHRAGDPLHCRAAVTLLVAAGDLSRAQAVSLIAGNVGIRWARVRMDPARANDRQPICLLPIWEENHREELLNFAEARGWPRLDLGRFGVIPGQARCWHRFVGQAPLEVVVYAYRLLVHRFRLLQATESSP